MNFDNLKRFVVTVQKGSVTEAARVLGMPKSSLSRHLSQLEQELQLKLLNRHPRNLTATEAGKQLFQQVSPLIDGLLEAEQDFDLLNSKPRGRLTIQAPVEFISEEMTQLCVEFLQAYPDIQLCFTQFIGMLPSNMHETDICFVLHDSPLPNVDVVARPLMSFPQSIYCNAHCQQAGTVSRVEELGNSQLILQSDETDWHFRGQKNQRISIPVSASVTMNSQAMRLHACLRGLGLARLPDFSVEHLVSRGAMKKVLLDFPLVAQTLSVLYRHRQVPRRVQVFVEFVQNNIGRLQSRL